MNGRRVLLGIALLPLAACVLHAGGVEPGVGGGDRLDPRNATYQVDGREVRLTGGSSTTDAAPGSASRIRTGIFGAPAFGDLDGDGHEDAAALLVQEIGGSGTFYYTVAVLGGTGGARGTNGVLLGDRIAPQNVGIAAGTLVVDYADRRPGEPMAAPPSEAKRLALVVQNGDLVVQPPEATGTAGLLPGIAGTEWRLVRLAVDGADLDLTTDAVPTLTADVTGKVHGLASLNRYFGQGEFGTGGRVRWAGPFGSTMMAGPEPLMDQEQAFLGALGKARRVEMQGGRLVFQDETGGNVLEFER